MLGFGEEDTSYERNLHGVDLELQRSPFLSEAKAGEEKQPYFAWEEGECTKYLFRVPHLSSPSLTYKK